MKISYDEIREAVRTLKNNDAKRIMKMIKPTDAFATVPVDAAFIGICSPSTTYDLKNVSGWTGVEEYSSQMSVMEHEVGKLDEVRFVETTNAKVFAGAGSGSIDVHGTMIIGQDFYGISRIAGAAMENIVKPLGSAGTADPLNQRQTQGWKATFVAMILNENTGLRLEHAVT